MYEAELEHDGRKYAVKVADLRVLRCRECGTIVLGDEAEERLTDALRAAAGLLTPAEIRHAREAST